MVIEIYSQIPEMIANLFNDSFISNLAYNYPTLSTFLVILLPLILIGFIIIFFDFIVDAWKMPFAIGVDWLKIKGIENEYFAYASILAGPLVFYLLIKDKNQSVANWTATISGLISVAILFLSDPINGMIALIPINTFLMFIACIID